MYGYQLRAAFEEAVGGTWPLDIGQVYTTLSRLERDDLVRPLPENEAGQRPYEITDAGRRELATWFATPVGRNGRPRDELAVKLSLALTTPGSTCVPSCRPNAVPRCARCRSTPGLRGVPMRPVTWRGCWCSTR